MTDTGTETKLFSSATNPAPRTKLSPTFRSHADREYNTLHFALQSRVPNGAYPPLDSPSSFSLLLMINLTCGYPSSSQKCKLASSTSVKANGANANLYSSSIFFQAYCKRGLWYNIFNHGKLPVPI